MSHVAVAESVVYALRTAELSKKACREHDSEVVNVGVDYAVQDVNTVCTLAEGHRLVGRKLV